MNRETTRLKLIGHSAHHLRTLIEGTEEYERRFGLRLADGVRDFLISDEVSPEFLGEIRTATTSNPWKHGFVVVLREEDIGIGLCGYTGPPDADGVVEIGYGIVPQYQGRGFATEAALALIGHAVGSGEVLTVRAHTLPEHNASTRVLTKCGFECRGEIVDPEDGPVWRWETRADETNRHFPNPQ